MGAPRPHRLGGRAATTELQALARDKIGFLRHGVRGELRGLAKNLGSGELVLSMGLAAAGWKGRLIVATDRRVLLLSKWPLRPIRCDELPYEQLTSVSVDETSQSKVALVLTAGGEAQSWQILPPALAAELAKLAGERIGAEKVSVKRVPGTAQAHRTPRRRVARALIGLLVGVAFALSISSLLNSDDDLVAGQCLGLTGDALSCLSKDASYRLVDTADHRCALGGPTALPAELVREAESRELCIDPLQPR